jgi:hypothetical protein
MDPDIALSDMLDALARCDWDQVSQSAKNLLRWLNRGGFPPVTLGPKNLGDDWHRMIALLACRVAESKATIARESLKRQSS